MRFGILGPLEVIDGRRVCLALQVCDVLLGAKVCQVSGHRIPP
jgi:hypothetical protein